MAITHYFLEPYPGGKQTVLRAVDVVDGKERMIPISTHRSRAIAECKRDRLNEKLARQPAAE